MRRVGSIREVADISLELPAGAEPYEDFDFEPYFEEARHEEELRKTWRVFTKVKDVLDNGRRLENASWRLWFKERRNTSTAAPLFSPSSSSPPPPAPPPRPPPPPPSNPAPPPPTPSRPRPPAALPTTTSPPPMDSEQHDTAVHDAAASAGLILPARPPRPVLSDSSLSSLERYDVSLDGNLRKAEEETDRIVGDMFGGVSQRFHAETLKDLERAKTERTRALFNIAERHGLSDQAVDDILQWTHTFILPPGPSAGVPPAPATDNLSFRGAKATQHEKTLTSDTNPSFSSSPATLSGADENDSQFGNEVLPTDTQSARAYLAQTKYRPRPRVVAFSHSLERNGANNFLLYLLKDLMDDLSFTLIAPKDGPMRTDYENLGIHTKVCSMKSKTYKEDLRLLVPKFDYAIANTIMTMEVVHACSDLYVPCLWVIHEAWPKNQFDYYAKEVFMMSSVDSSGIVSAFQKANKIVFPANVQYQCYHGLFHKDNAKVIYNGIPLASINTFRATQVRKQVRAELGYAPSDFIILHMGSVCKRKGQLITCEAFGELREMFPGRMKLLMVGARYIRKHEVDYIDECRATLEGDDSLKDAVILDVKKNVLPYYLAADVVVCPSINEVLPLVICEAMAFEKPVIASKIDGIPEAINDGVEGLLIEPGNVAQLVESVEDLVLNEDKRKRMGKAGRKRVLKQFSFEIMSQTYRETIGEDLKLELSQQD